MSFSHAVAMGMASAALQAMRDQARYPLAPEFTLRDPAAQDIFFEGVRAAGKAHLIADWPLIAYTATDLRDYDDDRAITGFEIGVYNPETQTFIMAARLRALEGGGFDWAPDGS